jgi:hypothetical protein
MRVRDVFDDAFELLQKRGVRDEYAYKAALVHRILLGKHSLRTASLLTEFRVGDCKADVAILNGTTTVYEIKSERDSLSRLDRQIAMYRQVFASVYVTAGENHIDAVLKAVPTDVGVMKVDRRYYTETVREARDTPHRIVPLTVFEALRTPEVTGILARLGYEIPDVPNTLLRRELRTCFEKLNPEDLHAAMLIVLKESRNLRPLSTLIEQLPYSLQPAALSVPLRRADHKRLVEAVNTPLSAALEWA